MSFPSRVFLLGALLLVATLSLESQSAPGAPPVAALAKDHNFRVDTAQAWTDTGMELHPGDVLMITSSPPAKSGFVRDGQSNSTCDPAGSSDAQAQNLPLTSAPAGALIGKLQPGGAPFLIALSKQLKVEAPGKLFLGANSSGPPVCKGAFVVSVTLAPAESALAQNAPAEKPSIKQKLSTAAQVWMQGQFGNGAAAPDSAASSSAVPGSGVASSAAAATSTPLAISKSPLDPALTKEIDALPRRVNDEFNNLGDMVNFVLVGSLDQVQGALSAADWHVADTNNTEAAVKAVLETYQKKDYLAMPMSQLRLFGRVQDFGYEQAQAYSVVASRHHFRLWKAPFTWNGQTVWVGAGTHDIGFEKDQRNGKVTHKIDPAVDGERENIGESLQKSGKVKAMYYYLPPNPVQDARNATGGGYHSDGRILVMLLQ
ncbi:MAG TPA: LssY C-terminal domain-containing protein [Terriglobales bacterium]|nr:LssY C-terminal domain-containing protein [Terriglobales bacterium]